MKKHKGLICISKKNSISRGILDIINYFLNFGKEGVALNVQISSCSNNKAGIPLDSIGRLLFIVYVNNLYDSLN